MAQDWATTSATRRAELRRQINGVLADPRGRWILLADPNGQSEAAFTSALDGEPARVVVDRTFVDDGARWIVEYKTAPSLAATNPRWPRCATATPRS